MDPIIAILGRPNVGKSTLFNQLTRSRDALVIDQPGMTRDRRFGHADTPFGRWGIIDTGGLQGFSQHGPARDRKNIERNKSIDDLVDEQALKAANDADLVLLVVDVKSGLTVLDENITTMLRTRSTSVIVVANKVDGSDPDLVSAEFNALGLGQPIAIAAKSGRGIRDLVTVIAERLEVSEAPDREGADNTELTSSAPENDIRIAIIGRPNVGKSTLTNRLLGEERVIVSPIAGTTRDSIREQFERQGKSYTLIDTAGIRRKSKVDAGAEKFSVVDALKSMSAAHIALIVIDASEGMTDQDATILGLAIDSGRSIVIAANKWDGLDDEQKDHARRTLERKLSFCDFAVLHFISALHGSGTGKLFKTFEQAYHAAKLKLDTKVVTDLLYEATEAHPPPLVRGRRIKLRYAHIGGQSPPRIIVHGNQTNRLPQSYQRYLSNFFREKLRLIATPVVFEFRSGENPYKDRKNKLTPRQARRRKRLMKHVKK